MVALRIAIKAKEKSSMQDRHYDRQTSWNYRARSAKFY